MVVGLQLLRALKQLVACAETGAVIGLGWGAAAGGHVSSTRTARVHVNAAAHHEVATNKGSNHSQLCLLRIERHDDRIEAFFDSIDRGCVKTILRVVWA